MRKLVISVIAFVLASGISYLLFAGAVWRVMTLLGFRFSWAVATAVWIIAFLLQNFIRGCQKR